MNGVRACSVGLVLLALASLGDPSSALAAGFQVLTAGKIARFENQNDPAQNGGFVVVGRDRALRTVHDPTCPAASAVEIEAYLQSTFRDAVLAHVDLDCAKWSAVGKGFQYAATRVALYADADPSNDPPVIGVGSQACAACHNR